MNEFKSSNYKQIEWLENNIIRALEIKSENDKIDTKYNNLSNMLSIVISILSIFLGGSIFLSSSTTWEKISVVFATVLFALLLCRLAYFFLNSRQSIEKSSNVNDQKATIKDFNVCVMDKVLLCDAYKERYLDPICTIEYKQYYYYEIIYYITKALIIIKRVIYQKYIEKIVEFSDERIINTTVDKIELYRFLLCMKSIKSICEFLVSNLSIQLKMHNEKSLEHCQLKSSVVHGNSSKSIIGCYNEITHELKKIDKERIAKGLKDAFHSVESI